MKKYSYFESHVYVDGNGMNFGNGIVAVEKLIVTQLDLVQISEEVEKVVGTDKTVILSFNLLGEVEK